MHISHIFILLKTYAVIMKTATIILIYFDRKATGIEEKEILRTYRKLYGYDSCSHYGRYHNRVDGLLDKVKGIRITKGLIMVRNECVDEIINFLVENKANYRSWKVVPSDEELELIGMK